MSADGQIQAEDVIRTYRAIQGHQKRGVMVKVQRVNRGDGWLRKSISKVFNLLFLLMYGVITADVNGTPKFFNREDLQVLKPTSKDSFIDSELMIKAKAFGLNIVEVPATFYQRQRGSSAVRVLPMTLEFLKNLILFRFGRGFKDWLAEECRYE
jgi:hypothetical protein